jgi:hypothetical protein
LVSVCLVLAGCQTQSYNSGNARADALMAELQAESVAAGTAATAITVAGSLDPSGMAAGPAHALRRGMLNAHTSQVNARIQGRIMAEEMAVMKCFEDSKSLSGEAAADYARACSVKARGVQ